jgi:hypothetical protein
MTKSPLVKCPRCGAEAPWSEDNPSRPFCSPRCKQADFIAWANEEQVIAGNTVYDDVLSEDLKPLH